MSAPIAAIAAVNPSNAADAVANLVETAPTRQQPFEMLEKAVNEVNSDVVSADNKVRSLALGNTGNLHDVMFALEGARVSMGLMVQVRNRLVDAYQDLMRMQI